MGAKMKKFERHPDPAKDVSDMLRILIKNLSEWKKADRKGERRGKAEKVEETVGKNITMNFLTLNIFKWAHKYMYEIKNEKYQYSGSHL